MAALGGGVYVVTGARASFTACTIVNNTALKIGAGFYVTVGGCTLALLGIRTQTCRRV